MIPLSSVLSILYSLLPSTIVSLVQQSARHTKLFLILGGLTLALLGLQILSSLLNCWTEKYYFALNYRYLTKLNRKAMVIDYAKLESPHGQNQKNFAFGNVNPDDTYGTSNASLLPWRLVQLFSELFGLTSYTVILVILNPLLIVVLLASSVIPYLINQWFNKYCYERREEESAMTRKMVYTTTTKSDLRNVKDAIFYQTAKLLLAFYWKAVHSIVALRQKRARIAFFSIDLVTAVLILVQNAAAYAILIHRVLTGQWIQPRLFSIFPLSQALPAGFRAFWIILLKHNRKAGNSAICVPTLICPIATANRERNRNRTPYCLRIPGRWNSVMFLFAIRRNRRMMPRPGCCRMSASVWRKEKNWRWSA